MSLLERGLISETSFSSLARASKRPIKQHTLLKRNTKLHHKDKVIKVIKIQPKSIFRSMSATKSEPPPSTPEAKAGPQWLKPFVFKFDYSSMNSANNIPYEEANRNQIGGEKSPASPLIPPGANNYEGNSEAIYENNYNENNYPYSNSNGGSNGNGIDDIDYRETHAINYTSPDIYDYNDIKSHIDVGATESLDTDVSMQQTIGVEASVSVPMGAPSTWHSINNTRSSSLSYNPLTTAPNGAPLASDSFEHQINSTLLMNSIEHASKGSDPSLYTKSIDRNIIKLFQTHKLGGEPSTASLTTETIESQIPTIIYNNQTLRAPTIDEERISNLTDPNGNAKLNINDYLSCERNLTRLTVFYSNADVLNCHETLNGNNVTLLRCIDELLETKLIIKLGFYYYVQLQPLYISTHKMNCNASVNTTKYDGGSSSTSPSDSPMSKWPTTTSKIKITTSKLGSPLMNYEYEDYADVSPKISNETLISQLNGGKSARTVNKADIEYLNKFKIRKASLACTLIMKKATNRKKLIWKLYLILKNQTCIPSEQFRSYNRLADLKKPTMVSNKKAAAHNVSKVINESDDEADATKNDGKFTDSFFIFCFFFFLIFQLKI
jgi:hypothetical protein